MTRLIKGGKEEDGDEKGKVEGGMEGWKKRLFKRAERDQMEVQLNVTKGNI